MRFSKVSFENWRNFTRVEVDLSRRTFIVGPNASGKSNFLDIFRFLRDLTTVGGGFQEAIVKRGGISKLRCLAARRFSNIKIDIIATDEKNEWNYVLVFNQDQRGRPQVKAETVFKNGQRILNRPDSEDIEDSDRLMQTHLEQVNANKSFRELVEFFSSIRYLHLVPQLVREPDRSIGRRLDPFGGDFLEQIGQESLKRRSARLNRIKKALKIAIPQLKDLKWDRDSHGTPHLSGLYEHWRSQGAWQNEDQFSDGTLRLIGLLWSLLENAGPLLLEEPELSLHPGIIRIIPQLTARIQLQSTRQLILSTHSPDLLKDPGIGLDEVILLVPEKEGTVAITAQSRKDISELLHAGLSMAEAVFPLTSPKDVSQLSLGFNQK